MKPLLKLLFTLSLLNVGCSGDATASVQAQHSSHLIRPERLHLPAVAPVHFETPAAPADPSQSEPTLRGVNGDRPPRPEPSAVTQ